MRYPKYLFPIADLIVLPTEQVSKKEGQAFFTFSHAQPLRTRNFVDMGNRLAATVGSLASSLILVFSLSSCGRPDFSGSVESIDSLRSELESTYERFSAINCDSLQRIEDSINKHLSYIQKNYSGAMRRGMGKHLGDYRMVRKMVPGAARRAKDVHTGTELARKQLDDLRQALTGEFTHDAAGNKFTREYVVSLVREERTATEALIKEMKLITERSGPMIMHFNELYPRVRFWVDSIPERSTDDF